MYIKYNTQLESAQVDVFGVFGDEHRGEELALLVVRVVVDGEHCTVQYNITSGIIH